MAKKQYLDLTGLTTYDEEIKSHIDSVAAGKSNTSHTHDDRYYTESEIDSKLSGKANSSHTHNYAGSSSAGGAATSANKLNTDAGSATQPVYFEDGIPKATTYTLGKSVPSNAVFTDTVYTLPVATSSVLGGVKSGGDVTISSAGVITVNDDSHNHTIANVDSLQDALDAKVPTSRTVNGKALSADITLSASDVGAATSSHTHSSYVNQNAFSNVAVGTTTIAADSATDTLTMAAGTGISVSADVTNDKVTITNSGVRSIATGSSNGTISVNTNGTSANVAVKGLGSAAYTASTAYDAAGSANTALASAKTYTDGKIDAIVGEGASETLDTIGEISAAIEENQDMLDTLNSAIGNKSDKTHTHTVSHTPAGGISETSITPAGTVSQPTFTGTAASHNHSFTGTEVTLNTDFTPAGTVSSTFTGTAASHNHGFTGSAVTSGAPSGTATVASSTHTHKYTPAGTVSQPTFTGSAVTSGASSGTTSVYSITGVGSVPSLTASVANRCLTLTFSAGSVPTRSSVTLPSTSHTHSVTAAGTVSQPAFTGTEASTTSISGTATVAKSDHTHSVTAAGTVGNKSVTPAGTISSTFTGTEAEIAIDYTPAGTVGNKSITPAGTVSQPTFTGTEAKHKHTFSGTAATLTTGAANS